MSTNSKLNNKKKAGKSLTSTVDSSYVNPFDIDDLSTNSFQDGTNKSNTNNVNNRITTTSSATSSINKSSYNPFDLDDTETEVNNNNGSSNDEANIKPQSQSKRTDAVSVEDENLMHTYSGTESVHNPLVSTTSFTSLASKNVSKNNSENNLLFNNSKTQSTISNPFDDGTDDNHDTTSTMRFSSNQVTDINRSSMIGISGVTDYDITTSTSNVTISNSYEVEANPVHAYIYHRNSLSVIWLILAGVIHIIMWGILLNVTNGVIPKFFTAILVIMMVIVLILMLWTRFLVKKTTVHTRITHHGDGRVRVELSPDDETDGMSNLSVQYLALIAFIEGIMFAIFTASAAGSDPSLYHNGGFYSKGTIVQTLYFASILFLAIHRIIRPANRADPMRTLLELEVVNVCWDALDGSTLYQLLDTLDLNKGLSATIRFLMAFWYLSVGCRISLMFFTHLPPENRFYKWVLNQPYFFSTNPTVDRSLSALRLRCNIILIMTAAEFYALAVRVYIWTLHLLSPLQIEMLLKNILFLSQCYSAYDMYTSTIYRNWNSRNLGFGLKIPTRYTQFHLYRWIFAIFYIIQSVYLSSILIRSSGQKWGLNIFTDLILIIYFLIYCNNIYKQNVQRTKRFWMFPQPSFTLFPYKLGFRLSILMILSMYAFRLPGLYFNANHLNSTDSSSLTFYAALFIINLSTITIFCFGMFWSVAILIFHSDFTTCPDNYQAIHDPIINMVATATMTEGALDMLSATALIGIAELNVLPTPVGWLVSIFSVAEVFNACQCFGFQAMLSAGKNDSPLDLVKWKAYLRGSRFFIDLGVFLLRVGLWVSYDAVTVVFLIKNLYNLIHTVAQIERYTGGRNYKEGTLFTSGDEVIE